MSEVFPSFWIYFGWMRVKSLKSVSKIMVYFPVYLLLKHFTHRKCFNEMVGLKKLFGHRETLSTCEKILGLA